jgi:hypothetical protein
LAILSKNTNWGATKVKLDNICAIMKVKSNETIDRTKLTDNITVYNIFLFNNLYKINTMKKKKAL